jgi:hypothetical protein
MTFRLFLLWLHRGALALMTAAGGIMLLATGLLVLLALRTGHGDALARDLAAIMLAHLWLYAGGTLLLASAAWVFLNALCAAFACAEDGAPRFWGAPMGEP